MLRTLTPLCLLIAAGGQWAVAAEEPPPSTPGLQNVLQVHSTLFSGSEPQSEAGFDTLRKLGIKTILSVDGAMPEVEAARSHGLKYIHLPIGYDGIPTDRIVQLAKVAATAEGSIYVHCHHGIHRAPAAAAVLCLEQAGWTPQQAVRWMRGAGTSTNYTGLYRSLWEYQPPSPEDIAALTNVLPERCQPSGLVEVMVALEDHHGNLRASRDAGWIPPSSNPDIHPAHEALMLWEALQELQRTPGTAPHSTGFESHLQQATGVAGKLHQLLQEENPSGRHEKLDNALRRVSDSCKTCHERQRD